MWQEGLQRRAGETGAPPPDRRLTCAGGGVGGSCTAGSPTDVSGRRSGGSCTAGSPTDVQGRGVGGNALLDWLLASVGGGGGGHRGRCLPLYTPSPRDRPRLTSHLTGDRALPSGASYSGQLCTGGGGHGLWLRTLNPRFFAWPLELGLESRNPNLVAWPLKWGLGSRSPRFVAWPLELGLRTLNPCTCGSLGNVKLGLSWG